MSIIQKEETQNYNFCSMLDQPVDIQKFFESMDNKKTLSTSKRGLHNVKASSVLAKILIICLYRCPVIHKKMMLLHLAGIEKSIQ